MIRCICRDEISEHEYKDLKLINSNLINEQLINLEKGVYLSEIKAIMLEYII